jgi:hypothetical protein
MSIPHDHHFVPAFYLQQWAGSNGKLVEYTIKHHKLIAKPVGPKSTGYEYDLYTFPELPPESAQFVEQKFFEYADRTASIALTNHLTNAGAPAWTAELMSAWSRFVIALHLRHPDAMPELRAAAKRICEGSSASSQQEYERIKGSEDPPTFDEYLAAHDPLTNVKARLNLIVKAFDNEILGQHINRMEWAVLGVASASVRLLTSDRPVEIANLKKRHGLISLPISPTKMFVAVNETATLDGLRKSNPDQIVRLTNKFVVTRARKYVWALDKSQTHLYS